MRDSELNYFDWKIVADGVVEVSVDAGVELKAEHIAKAFGLVKVAMPKYFCVLAHRHESYSHTLESMIVLSDIEEILLYAVVVSNEAQRELGQSHRMINPKVKLFGDREDALQACVQRIEEKHNNSV
ncbi:MAG: hypothetical protein L3J70_02255 [Gammaproteobacteria bacterium]|nr:hypothetical protein [Gammaproteobacteria bacterium]